MGAFCIIASEGARGLKLNKAQRMMVLYPLDDIQSYIPARKPYLLSFREQEALQLLVTKLYNEDFDSYQSCIYQKGGTKQR